MTAEPPVLVVEDDEDDFFLTERVLRRYVRGRIVHLENGRAALDYLQGNGAFADRAQHPLPAVMFLDLKMNHCTGLEVLAALRTRPPEPLPKIYVLTGSNEPKDRELVKNSGMAAGYIVKPLAADHLTAIFGPPFR